ncbi:MAG TPA: DedA family protein [Blastocatellia bacterium]|nr:DedA family protein [Blastocatellia bacterium]
MEAWIKSLIETYGLYAIFLGVMIEGDFTLLLGGVIARSGGFTFEQIVITGTLAGFVGDTIAYGIGRIFRQKATSLNLYVKARPRLEKIRQRFGMLSVFAVKYIWGLRTTSAIFWGVCNFGFPRFAGLTFLSCGLWVLFLAGLGFFFTAGIEELMGRVQRAELWLLAGALLVIVVLVIRRLHLAERAIGERVEEK